MPTLWWCWGKVQGSTEDTLSGKQTSVTIFDGNPTQLLRWFKKTIKKNNQVFNRPFEQGR